MLAVLKCQHTTKQFTAELILMFAYQSPAHSNSWHMGLGHVFTCFCYIHPGWMEPAKFNYEPTSIQINMKFVRSSLPQPPCHKLFSHLSGSVLRKDDKVCPHWSWLYCTQPCPASLLTRAEKRKKPVTVCTLHEAQYGEEDLVLTASFIYFGPKILDWRKTQKWDHFREPLDNFSQKNT